MDEIIKKVLEEYSSLKAWEEEYGDDEMMKMNVRMEKWFINQEVFVYPFTCTIAGPTQSGKISLLKNILMYNSILFDKPPHTVVIVFQDGGPL
ncbi:unnamed protein product [Brachionus calyciflorus]|uniref:Uncharacterized protein n=1 Tax=Brachionus calyciflorus TaxID=104777 RepID=A0A813ZNR0_9BILA|nr:unnamed protein product [Brachionus calyciflorus]